MCPDANNAGRTKAHENGITDIYLLQIGYTLLGRLDIWGDGLHNKSAEWTFRVITEQ